MQQPYEYIISAACVTLPGRRFSTALSPWTVKRHGDGRLRNRSRPVSSWLFLESVLAAVDVACMALRGVPNILADAHVLHMATDDDDDDDEDDDDDDDDDDD